MSQTVIRNARVFCRNQVVLSDVLIERGIIAKIGSVRAGEQEIDARGRLLLPGAIDAHVHFRDLDEAYKEDWYSGSCAAAAGGVTTVIDQPNSKPPVCDERSYFRKQRAARKSVVDYGINAGIEKLDQIDDLWRLGVTAFGEVFVQEKSREELHHALQTIKRLNAVLCVHAERRVGEISSELVGIKTVFLPPGVPGVQTLLPLLLARLDQISLERLVNLVSASPAARFNLKNKGAIREGYDADLILVDPNDRKIITPNVLYSKCGWTPFEGCVAVFPSFTMVRGEVVFREGSIKVKKGWGSQACGAGLRQRDSPIL